MNLKKLLSVPAVIIFIAAGSISINAQTAGKAYEDMSRAERKVFVAEQARRIAREISANEYQFTDAFELDILRAVSRYALRDDNEVNAATARRKLRSTAERGQAHAPKLMGAFKARNVSPLIGLYLPWVESAYVNISSPNTAGAVGMFQFLPKTGARYGLSEADLLDVDKSADAAARYILDSLESFKDDPMKEALALLSYNRGVQKTARDLTILLNDQNKQCSICALTADRSKLDKTFQNENVYYVPLFFAAAIIGENPQVFGLPMQRLSSYETSR